MDMPVCPHCKAGMVKAIVENEEGHWGISWLCECEVDDNTIKMIETEIAKEQQ